MKNLMVRALTLHRHAARLVAIVLFAVLLSATSFHAAFAQTGSLAGSAQRFAVLGGPAVTCTDFTITGDVGIYPGSTVNQMRCTINGAIHAGDAVAGTAYNDFYTMYTDYAAAGSACGVGKTGSPLGGETLAPEIYCFNAAANLGGTLTLDAGGDAGAVWIFVIGTGGTGALTATNFNVEMINGGQPSNVYWWVAEAATLTDSNFQGILLAGSDIAVARGTFNGDALSLGEVTLTGATLQSIAVTPNSTTIVAGETTTFTATGTYSDGTSSDITTKATWTSGSTEVASVISTSGIATGLTAGDSTITATYGTVSGTATLTVTVVTTATLQSIAVTPNPTTIVAGLTTPFTATGTYSDGTSSDITTAVTWTSDPTGVASISTSGVATGLAAGDSTITATYGDVSGTATLTVTAAPTDDDNDRDHDKDKGNNRDKDKGNDRDKDKGNDRDKDKGNDRDKDKGNRR